MGGETVFDMDGSPDVPCLWLTLERNGSEFTLMAYLTKEKYGKLLATKHIARLAGRQSAPALQHESHT